MSAASNKCPAPWAWTTVGTPAKSPTACRLFEIKPRPDYFSNHEKYPNPSDYFPSPDFPADLGGMFQNEFDRARPGKNSDGDEPGFQAILRRFKNNGLRMRNG